MNPNPHRARRLGVTASRVLLAMVAFIGGEFACATPTDPTGGGKGNIAKRPTVAFSADPLIVASGQPSTLSWSSTDAAACTASGGWSGTKSTNGSQPVAPTSTTTDTLTCTGAGGSAFQSVTVTVAPPPTASFTASPTTIPAGHTTTLTWSSANATACAATGGWSGSKAVSGAEVITPSTTATDTLTCTGPGGSVIHAVTVTVNPLPVVTFTATPTSIPAGQSTLLAWSTTNATSCTASGGWSGTKATSGSQSITPSATITDSLTCVGLGGTAVQVVTVTVNPLPTLTFTANPATIPAGQSSTLTWSTTNVTSCAASGGWAGAKAPTGSEVVAPGATAIDSLTCTGPGGTVAQAVTVTVNPLPTLTFSANPTSIPAGQSSTLTWSSANTTSCVATGGWTGAKATSGAQLITPGATITDSLICTGAGGTIAQAVTVTVNPLPTLTFSANPTSIPAGQTSTLTWSSTNTTSCLATDGWSGAKGTSGTLVISPGTTTTDSLTCTGPGGTIAQAVTVTVNALPTLTFSANPTSIPAGQTSTLTWSSTNTASCVASDGWSGAKSTSGTQVISPGATTTDSLTCTGPGGTIAQAVTVTVNALSTLMFSANPTNIPAGQTSTLTWSSTNTTSCIASDGWSGAKSTSGTQVISPGATATDSLTCTGPGGTVAQAVTVTVNPLPTLTFSANPTTIPAGQTSTLTWSSANTTSCVASDGWTGAQGTSGTQVITPGATITDSLTCTGAAGTIALAVTVTVNPLPTLTFNASPTSIIEGQTSTLTWSSTNTSGCVASGGWNGAKATSGSLVVSPGVTTADTLTCTGAGGTVTQGASITVIPLPTLTFTANPANISAGQSSTLTWSSANTTACAASDGWTGAKGTSGTLVITPGATITDSLTCTGPGGIIAQAVTISVTANPPPTLNFSASPTSVGAGQPSTLTWSTFNAASCAASGGWSGAKGTSGTAAITPSVTTSDTLTCTGSGGSVVQGVTVTVVPPPTVTLTATPGSIPVGQSSTLNWSSTNATACVASGSWSGAKTTSGTQVVTPGATITDTLTCSGIGGSTQQSVTITVNPMPTVSLSANPTSLGTGQTSTLTWSSANTTSCSATGGWSGSKATSGTQVVTVNATTTDTLTCMGPGGTALQTVTVTVVPVPSVTFTATPPSIPAGQTSTLNWSSTNATTCAATGGWNGAKATSGTLVVTPGATTTDTLTCTGIGGSTVQAVTITVNPLPTVTFSAAPLNVPSGGPSTLTWSSTNATACTASDGWTGARSTSGTQVINPTSTTTDSLTCTGAGGSASQVVTVTVVPAPTLTFTAAPLSVLSGAPSTLTWSSTNATTCVASDGWSGTKPTSGTLVINPTVTATDSLTCTGVGGIARLAVTVTVIPLPTVTFSATPAAITAGQATTLTWSTTNATSCTASGDWSGSKGTSGSQVISPSATVADTLTCTGPGGSAARGATVTVSAPPAGTLVSVGPTGHYLVDQHGAPFLVTGDAAWSLIVQLHDSEADTYLTNRQQLGFNLVLAELIEHKFGTNSPSDIYGISPFTGAPFATPNEAYFAHADYIIQSAARKGIVVLLDPLYLGFGCGDEGWCSEVQAASTADMTAWGQFVGNRYKNYDNIIWVIGGDMDPTPVKSKVTAFVNGILSVDTRHGFTAHNDGEQMAITPWPGATWLNINDIYTYDSATYESALPAYHVSPAMPFFLIEDRYEAESPITEQELRSQSYHTLLSGGTGSIFGNCPIWGFGDPQLQQPCAPTTWQGAMTLQGSINMEFFAKLFNSRHWYSLVPDESHSAVIAGYGTSGQPDYVVAGAASDGSSLIAYLPDSTTLTVAGSAIPGSTMTAWWYNPAAGVATLIGTFSTTGTQDFTPPSTGDWVLVVDNPSFGFSTPGQ